MKSNLAVQSTAAPPTAPQPQPDLRQRVQSLQLPNSHELSGSRRHWPFWLTGAVVVAVGGYFGFRMVSGPAKEIAQATSPSTTDPQSGGASSSVPPGPTNLSGAPRMNSPAPVASSGDIAHESKGYIIAAHQILISPKIPGMLTMVRFEEGQRVKKDDVLAQIETIEYQADFEHAVASAAMAEHKLLELQHGTRKEEIAEGQAELQEAEAQRNQLSAEWQRMSQLRKSGVSTQSEYDLAEGNFKAVDRRVERLRKAHELLVIGPRQERIDVAKADWDLAKADVVKAKWRLDNCAIRAPVSGTILIKNAEEGNIVNPLVQHGSYSLCEMADLADLEVDLKIQERDIAKIFPGQLCKIRAEAWPERVYEGYVSRLMPIADRQQGAVPVRVKIKVPAAEEGVYLKPEMGAVVAFLKGDGQQHPVEPGSNAGQR